MTPKILREKLDKAKQQNDPEVLEKILNECVSSGHSELTPDIEEARSHLQLARYDHTGG